MLGDRIWVYIAYFDIIWLVKLRNLILDQRMDLVGVMNSWPEFVFIQRIDLRNKYIIYKNEL